MLMILARLVRSESFWAVAKVRSPHTGPGIRYIIGRGDARVAPPCPTTLCVWRRLPYLTLPFSSRSGLSPVTCHDSRVRLSLRPELHTD